MIIICGVNDGSACGGYGEPLSPYKEWASQKRVIAIIKDVDRCSREKRICVKEIEDAWINKHPNSSFYFIGHSAGADVAIVVASHMVSSGRAQHIKGVVLLDPSMSWTPFPEGSKGVSLESELANIKGLSSVFVGASPSGDEKDDIYLQAKSPNEILKKYFNVHEYGYDVLGVDPSSPERLREAHMKLSQNMTVYNDVLASLR